MARLMKVLNDKPKCNYKKIGSTFILLGCDAISCKFFVFLILPLSPNDNRIALLFACGRV